MIEYEAFRKNVESNDILKRINSLETSRGIKHKIEYILTPDAFKLIFLFLEILITKKKIEFCLSNQKGNYV